MARARNIKPAFFKNYDLADAGPVAQLLFAGLWCLADREGRLEDKPRLIKAELFPYYDCDINGELTELERLGFVRRYKVGDVAVIEVLNFKKHQTPHNTEKASALPAYPGQQPLEAAPAVGNGELTVNPPLENDGKTPDSLIPDSLIPDSLIHDTPIPPKGVAAGFAEFWSAYPLKKAKATAEKAWAKLKPSADLQAAILSAIAAHKLSADWQRDGGQYIPHPTTWLNQRRWEDEVTHARSQRPDSVRPLSAVDAVKQAIAEREARSAAAGQAVDQDGGALWEEMDGEFRCVG